MKKKNPLRQSLYTLTISAVLVAVCYFVLKPQFQKDRELKERSSLLWKDAKREKILEIQIKHGDTKFALKKSGENKDWIVESTKSYDADSASIDSLISSILGTKNEGEIAIEPMKAGLDIPKMELQVVYAGDNDKKKEKLLQIGEDSPVDYQSYAKWSGEPKIFMIPKSLKFALDKKESDFRNKKIFKYSLADLKSIEVNGKNSYKLTGETNKWNFDSDKRKITVDSAALSDWFNSLSNTKVTSFPSENKKELSKYGLSRPLAKLNLVPVKGDAVEWQVGQVKNAKENHVYVTNPKMDSIYEVPVAFLDSLQKDPSDFRNKRLLTLDKSKVNKVVYSSKDLSITLTKKDDNWIGSHTRFGNTVEANAMKASVEKILNSFAVLKASKFLNKNSQDSSLGLNKGKLEFFNGENTPLTTLQVGNKQKEGEYVVWAADFEDPALTLLPLDELFPANPDKLLEKKAPEKGPDGVALPTKGNKKVERLDPTSKSTKELKKLEAPIVVPGVKYWALLTLKNGIELKLEFNSLKAPYTVSNFIHLARNHFYDGVVFHRVIKDFVIQGGDPTGTGRGGPGWMFNNEDNDLKHLKGSLSMAHAGRDTNGSQFFIVLKPQPHLDGLHTVFGEVTEGIEKIDSIQQGDAIQTVVVFQEK